MKELLFHNHCDLSMALLFLPPRLSCFPVAYTCHWAGHRKSQLGQVLLYVSGRNTIVVIQSLEEKLPGRSDLRFRISDKPNAFIRAFASFSLTKSER